MSNLKEVLARLCNERGEQFRLASFSKPEPESDFIRVRVRPIASKNGESFQAEQFTASQAFQKNLKNTDLYEYLAKQADFFRQILVDTADETVTILRAKRGANGQGGNTSIICKKKSTPKANGENRVQAHNRVKKYLVPEGIPAVFFHELGIMTEQGEVKAHAQDKFRQINRFLEFINDILPTLTENGCGIERPISIVDFGCGKSYLTFAVYYFLSEIKKLKVHITGLDLKTDVINFCTTLAAKIGYAANTQSDGCGMHFLCADAACYKHSPATQPDMVISLHACDTATDFALAFAVKQQVRIILSVPCCQHELNSRITSLPQPLSLFTKHGIVKERFASLATDVLRAEKLEQAGYAVQIIEFTDMADTPKNLLLRAVEKDGHHAPADVSDEYTALKNALGATLTLEDLL